MTRKSTTHTPKEKEGNNVDGASKNKMQKTKKSQIVPQMTPSHVASMEDDSGKKAHALAYQVLSQEESEALLEMSVDNMESKLVEIMQLTPTTCLRDAATLDFYVGAVHWAKERGFTPQQMSGFYTVIHNLLQKIKDGSTSMVDLLKEYRKQLVGIGVELNPEIESGGMEFFTVEQANAITNFLKSTLWQHYKLYEFMFRQEQQEEIVGSELTVEVPIPADTPFPPPLDEGITETTYREFMSLPTPSASETPAEEKADISEEAPQAELPPEAKDLFTKLTPESVKSIIEEVSKEMLQNLQIGAENKIRGTENAILSRINKIHNVLPDRKTSEEAV